MNGEGASALPVGVRADVIPGQDGAVLGFVVILNDLTDRKNAELARRHFEQSISQAERGDVLRESGSMLLREPDEVLGAIIANANANVAAMEIADAASGASVAPVLEELEASTRRAAALYRRLRDYGPGD